ncbi:hypothetical protein HDG34_003413 [Paraburkholderia sp. HC6.4b]|uniref:hypothetical protein n=1 Tax=unclassified Paraburkholderia TaxID=2615204 RepID=UPI00160C2E6C|nr:MULTISPECIES: hypothetical protein [unclassified Paraburkholderia]MBB5409471.1 hypothetical protein [Paraburkholderia sp. HC6.4b]MBB5451201.1 hypothetical protein [Paraburkholderia sp. Kb1A]MBC8726465.1 hypothetical protein [Paraburkholderia sp. 31.1]
MNAADIVERAAAMCVRLWIEGERISMEGPSRAVATIKPEIAAHKPEILAYLHGGARAEITLAPAVSAPPSADVADDCAGALIAPNGGAYLPWGPYLAAYNVRRLRGELFAMVDEVARAERWTHERYADTMRRAANGPLADLLPNIEYFHAKMIECRADIEARALLEARSWRYEGR